jgi:hypothetical protein
LNKFPEWSKNQPREGSRKDISLHDVLDALGMLWFVLPESGRSPDENAEKSMFFAFILFLPVTISGVITGYFCAIHKLKKGQQVPRGFPIQPTVDQAVKNP